MRTLESGGASLDNQSKHSHQSIRKDPFFHIGKQFNDRANEAKSLKLFASQLLKDLGSDEDELYSASRAGGAGGVL
jgi:hypothetical protein